MINAAYYPGVSTQHVEHGHTVDKGKGKGEFLFFILSLYIWKLTPLTKVGFLPCNNPGWVMLRIFFW